MSLHPPAPSDLNGLVDAYAQTVQSVIDLGRTMRPDDATRPTDCPGWTVLDQIAHVASAEAMVAGEPVPDVDVSHHAHVRHALRRADGALRRVPPRTRPRGGARRARGAPRRAADRLPERPGVGRAVVRSPFGPVHADDRLGIRTFDVWMHEQDVREALERPGGLDTGAAAHSVSQLFAELPRIVAKDAAVEPGNAVVLDLTGPTVGRAGARVEEHDGKARGIPLFTGDADEHPDVVTTSLTMSTAVAGRLAGGRRAPEDLHVVVHGDDDVAHRVMAAMVITP